MEPLVSVPKEDGGKFPPSYILDPPYTYTPGPDLGGLS